MLRPTLLKVESGNEGLEWMDKAVTLNSFGLTQRFTLIELANAEKSLSMQEHRPTNRHR